MPTSSMPVPKFAGGTEYEVGEIALGAGEALYIEEGSVVYGWVNMSEAHGARVAGRGIAVMTYRGQPINTILDARLITEITSHITLSGGKGEPTTCDLP